MASQPAEVNNDSFRERAAQIVTKCVNSEQDVTEIAQDIVSWIAPNLTDDKQQAEDQLYFLWTAILSHVDRTAKEGDLIRLKDLLVALYQAPTVMPDSERAVTEWIANLQGFGTTVRDHFNPPSKVDDTGISTSWAMFNQFLAILWDECAKFSPDATQPSQLCYDLYAIWSLRDALEIEQESESFRVLIPAAEKWIMYSPKQIRTSERQWTPSPRTGAPARPGPLFAASLEEQDQSDYAQKHGFSSFRWKFWMTRFETIASDEKSDSIVRQHARSAHNEMAKRESPDR